MQLKDYLTESLSKEYAYRLKIAGDCGAEEMTALEKCLQKYDPVSIAPWNRTPIEENPADFVRMKGVALVSEVCSTDVVVKYPTNNRILEVWIAVNMGIDPSRVICYGIKEARLAHNEAAADRLVHNKDRDFDADDAVLARNDDTGFEHYSDPELDELKDSLLFGEEYNTKFYEELKKIRAEKGDDYFRNYPTKDQIMGDNLRGYWDDLNNRSNMGKGEGTKEVGITSQFLGGPAGI